MKKLIALSSLTILLAACATHYTHDKFYPSAELAESSGVPLTELQEGHAVFMTQCSQCHEQRIPNEIPTAEWHKIVPGMAWNAGLSKEEESKVMKYLTAASKIR